MGKVPSTIPAPKPEVAKKLKQANQVKAPLVEV